MIETNTHGIDMEKAVLESVLESNILVYEYVHLWKRGRRKWSN